MMMIHQHPDYDRMTPSQVVSTFTTDTLLETKSKNTMAIDQEIKNSNLTLKAKKAVVRVAREEVDTSCQANFEEDLTH